MSAAGTIIEVATATVLSTAFIASGVRVFRENRKPRGIPTTDVWARIDAMREARAHGDVIAVPAEAVRAGGRVSGGEEIKAHRLGIHTRGPSHSDRLGSM